MSSIESQIHAMVAESIRKNNPLPQLDVAQVCAEPIAKTVAEKIQALIDRETTPDKLCKQVVAMMAPTTKRKRVKKKSAGPQASATPPAPTAAA